MKVTMSSDTSTLRCPSCAASVLPGAAWCGLCLTPIQAAPAAGVFAPAGQPTTGVFAPAGAPVDAPAAAFRNAAPASAADLFSQSRWRKSSTTFGPVGRLVLTICLFLPYPLFLINLPFGLVGVILWTGLLARACAISGARTGATTSRHRRPDSRPSVEQHR